MLEEETNWDFSLQLNFVWKRAIVVRKMSTQNISKPVVQNISQTTNVGAYYKANYRYTSLDQLEKYSVSSMLKKFVDNINYLIAIIPYKEGARIDRV